MHYHEESPEEREEGVHCSVDDEPHYNELDVNV